MNELNKRLATTIRLDEAHIAEVDEFLKHSREKNPGREITFSQAARFLILQGGAFERYERAETDRTLAKMKRQEAALKQYSAEQGGE